MGFPAWLDGASPCVRAELRRCGWNPDRGIGVDHWIEEIVRDGFVLHDLAVSMWRSLGGLELVNLDRSNSILIDPTDVQGYLTAPFDEWPKRYGQRFCPLGEWNVVDNVFIGSEGLVLTSLGSLYPKVVARTPAEALHTFLCT